MGERCALFLMGPTAVGKTDLALAIADEFPVALINADSAQVYRGMDVGTAKPSPEVRARYPHALMDFRDPAEPFSAGEYARAARREAEACLGRGRVPLLVGGTGLYFRAFAEGLAELPTANRELRDRLRSEAEHEGWPALHERLRRLDPQAAGRIHPRDGQRILRALEVCEATGRPLSELQREEGLPSADFPILRLALWRPREELWRRIEARFRAMLEGGLEEEVRALVQAGVDPDAPALRSVGYRQVREHLEGRRSREELLEAGVVATRRLAKRQLTWLRREPGVEWYRPEEREAVLERVREFLRPLGWTGR
ncbi:MAG: tRNA (adenosine(37)-N6)-dimethylallyltransferase MiaA [Thiohalorhabdus sp.]|uniref:tRNA (adenosine(37)-N6)-dimethylallyltransferase MiaA n=1 Tax=Thiohalorhabdus sp. TaxID=3094134 RepID=UPI00398170D0